MEIFAVGSSPHILNPVSMNFPFRIFTHTSLGDLKLLTCTFNFHPHIHVLVTEGGTAPDGAFHHVSRFHEDNIQEIFNHEVFSSLLQKKLITEDGPTYVPSKSWAEMIRKVYEVDPLVCPSCGGRMRIIAFIEELKTIDRIIHHLKLTFEAERKPPLINFWTILLF